ncbi:MAG TPA: SulP family inorganic anion transporter [Gemmatimonadaceae bacterium]|uniref:Sulfate transporter n=1 Tax=uncultured Gemmatimonadetes bacterium Rifle_16ft_4_minimus_37772 TaxID=1665097 RepID=A0A0H4T7V5_9BACT|nr:sulfate transporter [uncultured Gemmatimonadetes bacterium Rifle_16ft_4_minimus_37772]HLA88956.1 SulP family inorganic anion transporter [Gemmatimonadaceae bacterium]
MQRPTHLAGEIWGGVSAMLVALPSAIAFGVTIFAPLGGSFAARGAIAGILGAMAIGLVTPALGGTNRLISAPCAPAAALLSALAIELARQGTAPESAALMLGIVALLTAALQIGFGAVGLGRLIKYMPYPVVSGYLSGVGLLIILSQLPKLLGAPRGAHLWETLTGPETWRWQAIVVGGVTISVVLLAPRLTKAVPATIVGLAAGVGAYFVIALADRSLLSLAGNAAVVGPLDGGSGGSAGASAGASVLAGITGRFSAARSFDVAQLPMLLIPALSLAVLLSIDTLKTCVVVDALTRSRHNSNRELVAQGLGNFASTLVGGVPGAGTMGATLVNISSGAQTRLSGTIEGAAALVAFLALGAVLAWIPIAALAGILIVVGVRMFDKNSLHLLRSRATILDFVVIVSVVVVAETVSLIAASGVGVGLAILLFIREQVRSTVVRRRTLGNQIFSKQVRLPSELEILETRGERTAVFELQGSLFFGTTDQLYSALEADLRTRTYVILDMHRVRSVDVTAAHMLEQVADTMRQRPGELIFSGVPRNLPGGRDLARYLEEAGLSGAHAVRTVGELDEALEWVEERLLAEAQVEKVSRPALELHEIDLFTGRKAETLAELEALMTARRYPAGERIFGAGDTGDELFLVRRGAVRIVLPIGASQVHHLATFRRGDFFGEMAFLDRQPRSANAVAERETDLYVLSRARFDTLAEEHKRLAIGVLQGLARTLAIRLRHTNTELRALQEA